MLLEKTAEERRRREIQVVGDLLHGHLRRFQLRFRIEHDRLVDPFGNGAVGGLLNDRRQVFRRQTQLPRIKSHRPLLFIMQDNQADQLAENLLVAGQLPVAFRIFFLIQGADLVKKSQQQVLHDLPTITVLLAQRFLVQQIEQIEQRFGVVRSPRQHRSLENIRIKRIDRLLNPFQEFRGKTGHAKAEIVALARNMDDRSRDDED